MMIQQINLLLAVLLTTVLIFYLTWSSQGKEIRRFVSPAPAQAPANTCFVSINDTRRLSLSSEPMIYFITPSYPRREQVAELTRLGQTLMHVPNLHWIVADDNRMCNPMITQLLPRFGVPFTHISSPMPEIYRSVSVIPRGVANRRAALDWIRANVKSGVLYFGDDDNTFDLKLFEEIRDTNKVSMFPVGLIGEYGVSAPIVKEGKVVGFYDSWPAKRKFPVDMAGFAVNVEYLLKYPNATMPFRAGYEEDRFLRSLGITLDMIEPKADSCTQVLVWHTQTNKKPPPVLKIESSVDSSLRDLLQQVSYMGMASISNSNGSHSEVIVIRLRKKPKLKSQQKNVGVKTYMSKDGKVTAV
ncbi:galactosylgalactosylxylosylprotein 3-beta-glucuronosyltransferase S isoform X2 [Homalodisca vitripennis]|uniref:galactosylgalactosylxylosylprotein 3-beta-glucuronosyltransferase S isoform X2 n=1 Tax=Homalodisca vitripennis TaxID=197043 RepID=UPI001EEB1F94|nr:galactosylgalactosylxylosylprotein 3-beta-glucuronosyltransferase S isoform X2 [Homalodisca vitripennis]